MSIGHILLLIAAGGGAGVMNALAGGGTLLTYPTLLLFGLDAIAANATPPGAVTPSRVQAAGARALPGAERA